MKQTILALLCLAALPAVAQEAFTVKSHIKGLPDQWLYLERTQGDKQQVRTDSVFSKDGQFTFTGTVKKEDVMKAAILNGDQSFRMRLVLEPGTINIQGSKDSIGWIFPKGTLSNDLHYQFIQDGGVLAKEEDELLKQIKQAKEDSIRVKSLIAALRKNEAAGRERKKAFIKAHPDNVNSVFFLMDLSYFVSVPELMALYEPVSSGVKASYVGRMVGNRISGLKSTAIGAIAPEFVQPDRNDNIVALSSFRGKVVLIDFWASWCGPCRGENPNLLKMYSQYAAKGFKILAVSLDDNKVKWEKAIAEDGMPWTHVSDLKGFSNQAARLYGISAIPMNYLIDKNGKIIASNLRGEALAKKLAEIQW